MALTTLKSLDAEIKTLEAQKKLVERRDGEVPKALAVLQRYAKVLTLAQRRQATKIIGETGLLKTERPTKAGKIKHKLGTVAPKYRLPSGETWTGRGLTPKAFTAWAESTEGKAWTKANPEDKFPKATIRAERIAKKSGTKKRSKSIKKATKSTVAKKTAKKAGRKGVKQASA